MIHRRWTTQGFWRAIGIIIPVCLFFLALNPFTATGAYYTPGTGVNWTMDDLVTNSGGAVTGAAGVYQLHDYLYILENDTLTMSPGDVLAVDPGSLDIAVYGRLNAVGTSVSGITFTSGASTPVPGDWEGIYIYDNGSVNLNYCGIHYAYQSLYFDTILNTAPGSVIDHCNIANMTDSGINTYFFNGPTLDILNSQITGAGSNKHGLDMQYTGRTIVTISHNLITDHGHNGIKLYRGGENVRITNNIISGNGFNEDKGMGIKVPMGNTNLVITGNSITGNAAGGIGLNYSEYPATDYGGAESTTIAGNEIADNNEYGIIAHYSNGHIISSNTISGHATGIYLDYSWNNIIHDNTIMGNGDGIYIIGGI
ncbi:MAG: right-handed parallel beta-helix repeat-containing protein, partial [Deltaproteobacteria bacterium]|nr:right-handed parallel beta-helix repeat-containing protein [Deltaproteobacteria bacterium]